MGTESFSLCLDMNRMLATTKGLIPDPSFAYDVRFLRYGLVTKICVLLGMAKEDESFDHRRVEHKLKEFCHKILLDLYLRSC